MRFAGAEESIAQEIAGNVKIMERMPTEEIRKLVIEDLKNRNPAIAEQYERTIRFIAREIWDEPEGVVRITEGALRSLKVKSGEVVYLINKEKKHELRAKEADVEENAIELLKGDLNAVNAEPGIEVAIQAPRSQWLASIDYLCNGHNISKGP